MDTDVIVDAFVVVVIGGLGSFWGTFLGALIYGQVLSFASLLSTLSIFAILRPHGHRARHPPWGLLGKPLKNHHAANSLGLAGPRRRLLRARVGSRSTPSWPMTS